MNKKITCSVDSVVELIRANIKDIVSVPIRSAVAFRIDKNTFVLEWYGDKYKPHELMISIKCGIVTEIELALSQTNKKLKQKV